MNKAQQILEELKMIGLCGMIHHSSPETRMAMARKAGKPIPDDLKPGYLLTRLSPEDRKELATLTSEQENQVAWRLDLIA